MAQAKKNDSDSVGERLRRYQISQGLPWRRVAERLGVSLSMVMMVLRGDRNLSSKALYRLEQAEAEAADRKAAAGRLVEELIGDGDIVSKILGQDRKRKGVIEVPVDYQDTARTKNLPAKILIAAPPEEACRKLRSLFAETLDTRLIALACLPHEFRSEGFLAQLTAESRSRLTTAALGLVIPDWRTLVTGEM